MFQYINGYATSQSKLWWIASLIRRYIINFGVSPYKPGDFLPHDATQSAERGYATVCRPSVCL